MDWVGCTECIGCTAWIGLRELHGVDADGRGLNAVDGPDVLNGLHAPDALDELFTFLSSRRGP